MAIVVERKPHVEVSEPETGWSLRGGHSYADGTSTKVMFNASGALCTIFLSPLKFSETHIEVAVNGLEQTPHGAQSDLASKSELYRVAARLLMAWFQAHNPKSREIMLRLPTMAQ